MLGGVGVPARGGADDHRNGELSPAHVAELGRVVGDGIECDGEEVAVHDLRHRAQAAEGGPHRHAGDGRLGDWGVAHAIGAELAVEAAGAAVDAAVDADVLAHDEHPLIAQHLLAQRGAHGERV